MPHVVRRESKVPFGGRPLWLTTGPRVTNARPRIAKLPPLEPCRKGHWGWLSPCCMKDIGGHVDSHPSRGCVLDSLHDDGASHPTLHTMFAVDRSKNDSPNNDEPTEIGTVAGGHAARSAVALSRSPRRLAAASLVRLHGLVRASAMTDAFSKLGKAFGFGKSQKPFIAGGGDERPSLQESSTSIWVPYL